MLPRGWRWGSDPERVGGSRWPERNANLALRARVARLNMQDWRGRPQCWRRLESPTLAWVLLFGWNGEMDVMEPGQVVGDRYGILGALGKGGMGSVWAAYDRVQQCQVALKVIASGVSQQPGATVRFLREAKLTAAIQSFHSIRILNHGVDPEHGAFLVMELLRGEDLGARLSRRRVLCPRDIARIVWQVSHAIGQAHSLGIIHRDIKPSNIFLARGSDGTEHAKLLDFGIAKDVGGVLPQASLSQQGFMLGTLSRMSPELVQGLPVDRGADIWALGLTVFEAMVGCPVFDDSLPAGQLLLQICLGRMPVPSHFSPVVPWGFDEWFARATHRDPERRYQSVTELAEDLMVVCESSSGFSTTPSLASTARDPTDDGRISQVVSVPPIPLVRRIARAG